MPRLDVIVGAAGTVRAGDPMSSLVPEGMLKAMIPIAGRPMIRWVLDALDACQSVRNIVIVGLEPQIALECSSKTTLFAPGRGTIVDNAAAGVEALMRFDRDFDKVIWVAADLPLIEPPMLEWFIQRADGCDVELLAGIVSAESIESRFPNALRSYFRIDGRRVCACDVYASERDMAFRFHSRWRAITKARKNIAKQAFKLGIGNLLTFVAGRMTRAQLANAVERRLGARAWMIDVPFPEMAMDVDRPEQYRLAERLLLQPSRKEIDYPVEGGDNGNP